MRANKATNKPPSCSSGEFNEILPGHYYLPGGWAVVSFEIGLHFGDVWLMGGWLKTRQHVFMCLVVDRHRLNCCLLFRVLLFVILIGIEFRFCFYRGYIRMMEIELLNGFT